MTLDSHEHPDNGDADEILTLVNLLIRRVEYLATNGTPPEMTTTKKKNGTNPSPSIKQIDQDLTEYLYYLFNKFAKDDGDAGVPLIEKSDFVHVCQTLVRNGCLNVPSAEQSLLDVTLTNSNEITLTQTSLREHKPDADESTVEKSSASDKTCGTPMDEQDAWLIVDVELIAPQYSPASPDGSKVSVRARAEDTATIDFDKVDGACARRAMISLSPLGFGHRFQTRTDEEAFSCQQRDFINVCDRFLRARANLQVNICLDLSALPRRRVTLLAANTSRQDNHLLNDRS